MRVLQELVTEVRAMRARYAVPPKVQISAIVRASGADAMLVESQRHYLHELAGVEKLTIDAAATKPPHAAVGVAGGAEIFVPLEGLVDIAAERERATKELVRAQGDLDRLTKKLGNEGFLAKAATEVIEKDRAKATELTAQVAKLAEQIADLAD